MFRVVFFVMIFAWVVKLLNASALGVPKLALDAIRRL